MCKYWNSHRVLRARAINEQITLLGADPSLRFWRQTRAVKSIPNRFTYTDVNVLGPWKRGKLSGFESVWSCSVEERYIWFWQRLKQRLVFIRLWSGSNLLPTRNWVRNAVLLKLNLFLFRAGSKHSLWFFIWLKLWRSFECDSRAPCSGRWVSCFLFSKTSPFVKKLSK